MSTWINRCPFDTAHTWWRGTRKAVEKTGPWKLRKTNTHVSRNSHRPLEIASGDSHFPTASTTVCPLSPKSKGEEGSMKTRPDNSRVNKTGQL